jgi:5-oxoprolinase (ATP-hydrolysing)
LGLGAARIERHASREVLEPLEEVEGSLAGWLEELASEAAARVAAEGVPSGAVTVERRVVAMRWIGQESAVELPWSGAGLREGFAHRYRELFGYVPWSRRPEVVALRVAAAGPPGLLPAPEAPAGTTLEVAERRRAWFAGWREVPVLERAALPAGGSLRGPALVVEPSTACVVGPGWSLAVEGTGALLLRRAGSTRRSATR